MKIIKKFESFSTHRMPTKVGYNEWDRKLDMYVRETLTEKEKGFFHKLAEENNTCEKNISYIESYRFIGRPLNEVILLIYNPVESNRIKEVSIYKLQDNWYLIIESGPDVWDEDFANDPTEDPTYKYFICDEWDEVIGYIESNNLKI
jgi:hypothetical protein